MTHRIPWWSVEMGKKEYKLVQEVLASGYLNDGDITASFEKTLAKYLGVKHVVASTSGTTALFMALVGLGVTRGDEVIIPDLTFVATANAITLAGAKPVLVDIDPKTLTIDPGKIQKKITHRTKAIIPVHISGRASNMDLLINIAHKHNLLVIEDAAEALGSRYHHLFLGTIGDAGCYSFTANKIITCGQGGAIATNNEYLYQKLRRIKDQGRAKQGTGGADVHEELGFNFKLTNLQAAVLLGQFEKIKRRLKKQQELYSSYKERLIQVTECQLFPFNIDQGEVPLWIDALCDKRDELEQYLQEQGIECRKFWLPVHAHRPYKEAATLYPQSTTFSKRALWLPSSFQMSQQNVNHVAKCITAFYKKHSV